MTNQTNNNEIENKKTTDSNQSQFNAADDAAAQAEVAKQAEVDKQAEANAQAEASKQAEANKQTEASNTNEQPIQEKPSEEAVKQPKLAQQEEPKGETTPPTEGNNQEESMTTESAPQPATPEQEELVQQLPPQEEAQLTGKEPEANKEQVNPPETESQNNIIEEVLTDPIQSLLNNVPTNSNSSNLSSLGNQPVAVVPTQNNQSARNDKNKLSYRIGTLAPVNTIATNVTPTAPTDLKMNFVMSDQSKKKLTGKTDPNSKVYILLDQGNGTSKRSTTFF